MGVIGVQQEAGERHVVAIGSARIGGGVPSVPARSTVGVAGLAGTYIVEVEAVAVIREAGR